MNCIVEKPMGKSGLHFDATIVGLGKTGLSCVRFLQRQGLTLAVTDSRTTPPELAMFNEAFGDIPAYLGGIDSKTVLASGQVIVSPGVSLENPAIKNAIKVGIPVVGDIEIFCRHATAPVIAITGSNGKSTVTTLVAAMARDAGRVTRVGGNLGTPALALLDDTVPDLYVLELSSFQLETTFSLNAHAGAVLNISPDHMDRHVSLEAYVAAKRKVYLGQGIQIINHDDAVVRTMIDVNRNSIGFSLSEPSGENFGVINEGDNVWLCQGKRRIIKQKDLKISGQHNTANALAAMALASTFNIDVGVMKRTLQGFTGLDHRCQRVATINNVAWYNDSKATNVDACIASVNGLRRQGEIILIAGGNRKGADVSRLKPVIDKYVRHVLLLGRDAKKIAAVVGDGVPVTFASTMNDAVGFAYSIARPGNIVLLAPACASQDLFKDYRERGEAFIKAVKSLEGGR